MEEWKEYKLGDIANIQTGPFGSQLHKSDYKPMGIPCIMPCNISLNLDICCDNIAYISEEDADRLCKHKTQTGDIIYSRRGDIEKCAYISEKESGWVCGTGCLKIRIDSEKAIPKFVAYQLSTPLLKSWIVGSAIGTTMLNLNTSILSVCPISIPSLPTQQKIANILSSLDDKIEVNRRINEQLEELAQALFKSWFVDFEPFKDGEFVESELGMIPKGWKVCELSDILYISKDSINPSKTPDNQFHHYSIPAYDNSKREEVQEGKAIMSNKFKVTNKTTLFSKLNPRIKRVWFIDNVKENAICSTEFVPYKAKNNELTYYVNGLINSDLFYNQALSIVNGATGSHQRFHPQDTLKFNIAFNESVAKEYSTIVEPVVSKILVNQQEILHLTTLRDTLLPKLMSGEIEV